jgi:adenine phosphoribosyltransferase
MSPADLQRVRAAIRDVPDFPKPGIVFKDITPVLSDGPLFNLVVGWFAEAARAQRPDKIVGIDARGFIFGGAVAHELGVGFVPVRKKGKLPFRCEAIAYALEYGEASVEMHVDALHRGERVVLIDDLLATGGTAAAAIQLIKAVGGELAEVLFLVELTFLSGRGVLGSTPARALIEY